MMSAKGGQLDLRVENPVRVARRSRNSAPQALAQTVTCQEWPSPDAYTKAALAAYKARGSVLGAAPGRDCRKLSAEAAAKGSHAAATPIGPKPKRPTRI
jgi:hypothetical protein